MNLNRWTSKGVLAGGAALGVLILASSAFAQSAPAAAQSTPAAKGNGQVEEVVVTANKRPERLRDVAMSVSAVSGESLARSQALDLQDLSTKVGGLSIQQQNGGLTRVILRGQNTGGAGATVATVVDDIPISFSGATSDGAVMASDFDTYDLSQIEVLRGPQGTLYGATAEGGLLKYVTNAPNPNGFHAGVELGGLTVAHGESAESAKGYLNIPLANGSAAIRLSGYYESIPGWVDNNFLGETKVNDGRRYGGRLSLLWRPTNDLTIKGMIFLQDRDQNGNDTVAVNGSAVPSNPLGIVGGYNMDAHINPVTRNRMSVYGLNIEQDLHWARLQSITSYGEVNTHFVADQPGLAPFVGLYEFFLGFPITPSNQVSLDFTNNLKKFNQEFRLSSEAGSNLFNHPFDWQVGAFYTKEDVVFNEDLIGSTFPAGVVLPDVIGNLATYRMPSDYKDVAGYVDGTYHFTPQFDIEAGARISRNTQTNSTTESGLFVTGVNAPTVLPSFRTSQTVTTYSVAPRYHLTPDVMIYARVATGYRPGGPELPILGAPSTLPSAFKADHTVNYEAGLKGEFFDHHVSADVSVFHIDWTDIQMLQNVTYTVGGATFNTLITGNGGKAVSQGFEFNFGWMPVEGLSIGYVGAYTDAHLTTDAPGIGAHKGDKLAYVPKFSSSLSANYDWSLTNDYRAFVGGSWAYVGKRPTDLGGQINLPAYNTFALQGGVRRGAYSVELYAKNLGDERGVTFYAPGGGFGGHGGANLIRPRTVGVRVTADF